MFTVWYSALWFDSVLSRNRSVAVPAWLGLSIDVSVDMRLACVKKQRLVAGLLL